MKKPINKSPVFVKIESPLVLRRDLLRSTLYSVKILRDYEEFLNLNIEKERWKLILFQTLRESNKVVREIKRKFPAIKKKEEEKKEIKKAELVKRAEPKKEASESERLREELLSIEEKLKRLEI